MRDLIEELAPYIKECLDRRQEKLRRMRKRDLTRLAIVRIFEIMAEQRSLGKRILDTYKKPPSSGGGGQTVSPSNMHALKPHQLHQPIVAQQHMQDEQQLRKTFNEYVEGMLFSLEQDTDGSGGTGSKQQQQPSSGDLVVPIRLHFSMFVYKLTDSVQAREKRALIFPESVRFSLFALCDRWAGRFSLAQQHNLTLAASSASTAAASSQQQQQQAMIQQQQNIGLASSLKFNNSSNVQTQGQQYIGSKNRIFLNILL